MIPEGDNIYVVVTAVINLEDGGLVFQPEQEVLYIEQNIAATSKPVVAFVNERIGKIFNSCLILYLEVGVGQDIFKTIRSVTRSN